MRTPDPRARATLSLAGVTLERGGRTLLRGVDLAFGPGFTAVVGPNGAGKTTLLRTMAALLQPSAGTVRLNGRALTALQPRERALQIAYVDPSEPVLAALSVRETVAAARFPHHRWWEWETTARDEDAIGDALERTHLTALGAREIATLSSGERQRVWIALAIAQRASVVLLDEPTSHLDLKASVETLRLVRDLARDGAVVVAVLHQLEEAASFADRVLVIGPNEVVADGPPREALTEASIARAFDVEVSVEHRPGGPVFHRSIQAPGG